MNKEKGREENWQGVENVCMIEKIGENHISHNPKRIMRIGYWVSYIKIQKSINMLHVL